MRPRGHIECRLDDITKAVGRVAGIHARYLADPDCREKHIEQLRTMCYRMARDYTPLTYRHIGKYFGRSEHTVRHRAYLFSKNTKEGRWPKRKALWASAQQELENILNTRKSRR